jgi:hypothetical protein
VRIERDGQTKTLMVTPAERPMLDAMEAGDVVSGVRLRISSEPWGPVMDFEDIGVADAAIVPTVSLEHLGEHDGPVTLRFDGYVRVPADGEYVFRVEALEGATVTVGGCQVAVNDPLTDQAGESTPMRLAAGLHPIIVDYYYFTGPRVLELTWEGPGIDRQGIAAESLFVQWAE